MAHAPLGVQPLCHCLRLELSITWGYRQASVPTLAPQLKEGSPAGKGWILDGGTCVLMALCSALMGALERWGQLELRGAGHLQTGPLPELPSQILAPATTPKCISGVQKCVPNLH